jgi:hypothetical protein
MTFALLGLTTAAGLGLVLLFAQATPPIPSLGPLIEPATGHHSVHRGIALEGGGVSQAAPTRAQVSSSASPPNRVAAAPVFVAAQPPLVPAAGGADSGAPVSPQGKFGSGPTSVEGIPASDGGQELGNAQQPSSAIPNGEQPAEGAETPPPVAPEPSTPTSPATPTSEPPPVAPEEPQAPVEEAPAEPAPEEPPAAEEPVAEGGGFLVAVGQVRDTP